MRTTDEKCLHFVLRHYQKNKLDTQKALKAFKEKYQITEQERKSFRLWWILPGMAAAILVAVLIYPRFRENGAWKEVTAYSHPVDYMLPDSSSITLFPHSSVRFHAKDYRKSSRKVHMEGKVAFSVKHDNAHPFTVEGNCPKSGYWVLSLPSMRAVQTQLSCKSHRERCSSQQSGNRTL